VRDILVKGFPVHNIAVTAFRGNINWFSKYRLKKAWQQYHSGHCFDAEAWSIPKEGGKGVSTLLFRFMVDFT
jgi:hypothetical protein